MTMQMTNEDIAILERMCNMLSKEARARLTPLREIEKHRLLEATTIVCKIDWEITRFH